MVTRTVYFATNRQPITRRGGAAIIGFGSDPGPVDGAAVRFGSVDIEVDLNDPDEGSQTSYLPETLAVAEEQLVGTANFTPKKGSKTVFDALRQSMKRDGKPTIVIIHGYSNSFEDAMRRAAWIGEYYKAGTGGIDANVFAFSWPSRGSDLGVPLPFVDYIHDRATAAQSGVAVARTLRILHRFIDGLPVQEYCHQPIHLVCHSMGNFVLRHAMAAMIRDPEPVDDMEVPNNDKDVDLSDIRPMLYSEHADPNPSAVRRTFDQIILAAADVDDDAFDKEQKFKYLPRLGRQVTVYHSHRDWILNTLSRITKFNGPRLGVDGPDNMSTISDKVAAVDVSELLDHGEDSDRQNHQYYRKCDRVRDDIIQVLAGKRPNEVAGRSSAGGQRWRLG
ncbi:MAG TPA: alpha/beta fold hydrolase [Azospirillaceae bacterium]|nr:alpha/beta fold hydrolase [Azospirillaceae bacterium]